jgi:hypothetical protein
VKSIRVIPTPDLIEMANNDELFNVTIEPFCSDFLLQIQLGEVHVNDIPSSFEKWLSFASDVRLSGWGKNSGLKLWQVSRKLQREVYRKCKMQSSKI